MANSLQAERMWLVFCGDKEASGRTRSRPLVLPDGNVVAKLPVAAIASVVEVCAAAGEEKATGTDILLSADLTLSFANLSSSFCTI